MDCSEPGSSPVVLHAHDQAGGSPSLIFLPGLAASGPIFEELIHAGLAPRFRCLSLDLRGRGRSPAPRAGADPGNPAAGYRMADHAADVLAFADRAGLEAPILVGHSFGGLLALWLAATHPDRFGRLVVLDAGIALATSATLELLRPTLARIGAVLPTWEAYLGAVRRLPFLEGSWCPGLERYFREDSISEPDGRTRQRVDRAAILAAIEATLIEDWPALLARIRQPVLLLNAVGPYGPPGAAPFLSAGDARATAAALSMGRLETVGGNHITMLFGEPARRVAGEIAGFLR